MKSVDNLPLLAFGEAQATVSRDARSMSERLSRSLAGINIIEPGLYGSNADRFLNKTASLDLKNVHLLSTASTANIFDLGEKKDALRITLPFYGRTETCIENSNYRIVANEIGLMIGPYQRATGFCESNHCLVITPSRESLKNTAEAMFSREKIDNSLLNPEQTRELNLRATGYSIAAYFLALSRLIDDLITFPETLHNIGIEDLILRQLVYLLVPEAFRASDEASRLRPHERVFDLICDQSLARLEKPLTRTEMEQLTGVRAKQLTREFRLRFGCTPVEWQRRERLSIARDRLLHGDRIVNIATLSADLGFASVGSFSSHYKKQFGERPEESFHRNYLLRSGYSNHFKLKTKNYVS